MGLTHDGGRSCLEYAVNCRDDRNSSFPEGCSLGSGHPNAASIWPTAQKAPSTVQEWTAFPLGANNPSW
jgi:hypothetical protein